MYAHQQDNNDIVIFNGIQQIKFTCRIFRLFWEKCSCFTYYLFINLHTRLRVFKIVFLENLRFSYFRLKIIQGVFLNAIEYN